MSGGEPRGAGCLPRGAPLAIVGGAILPPATGKIADSNRRLNRLEAAFLLPMVAYVLICAFADRAAKARVLPAGEEIAGDSVGLQMFLRRKNEGTHSYEALAGLAKRLDRHPKEFRRGQTPPEPGHYLHQQISNGVRRHRPDRGHHRHRRRRPHGPWLRSP